MQLISFKRENKQEFVNLDAIEDVEVTKKDIILYLRMRRILISKETLPETYELLKDYLENHLDYYKIN